MHRKHDTRLKPLLLRNVLTQLLVALGTLCLHRKFDGADAAGCARDLRGEMRWEKSGTQRGLTLTDIDASWLLSSKSQNLMKMVGIERQKGFASASAERQGSLR